MAPNRLKFSKTSFAFKKLQQTFQYEVHRSVYTHTFELMLFYCIVLGEPTALNKMPLTKWTCMELHIEFSITATKFLLISCLVVGD